MGNGRGAAVPRTRRSGRWHRLRLGVVSCGVRLLTREIHRAFEELDAYDDATCGRFVAAAWGPWYRRVLPCVAIVAVGLGATVASCIAWVVVVHLVKDPTEVDPFDSGVGVAVGVVLAGPMLGLGPWLGFVWRDVLLRRRVRFVLRDRGRCTCGYALSGLAVGVGNRVRCPECGHATLVDPSMAVLQVEGQGAVLGETRE
jgi:hypothetical protein